VAAALRRRWRLVAVIAALGLVVLIVAAAAVVSRVFSSKLLDPDHELGPYGVEVEQVEVRDLPAGASGEEYRITFERDETSSRPGTYGLDYPDGHAIAREVIAATDSEVTRRVTDLRGNLDEGTHVAFDEQVWEGNPLVSRGVPFREIAFRSELGPMPAWQTEGNRDSWAIFVHGHNVTRREGLRVLPTLRRAGLPTLSIAYRNDPDAPRSEDGLIHLGATEWRDLESAARRAIREGARSFVLLGDSMGGAIVSQFIHESPLAARVRALVLDAPVLDWRAVLDLQADERGLPGVLAMTTEWMVSARIDFDWSAFDQVARAREFEMPILLFHGTEDSTVPISSSDAFASALPDLVTYYRVARAGHVESWNVAPARYGRRVHRFLARVVG
jgi:alpha-beta hydrolase superfamily lysophospholipase